MKNLIVVATVPHTATRSIMTLVDPEGYRKLQSVLTSTKSLRRNKNREQLFSAQTDTHNHVYIQELNIEFGKTKDLRKCSLLNNKINVVHGHIEEDTIECIKELAKFTKLIVPCRDPLLTLLTTKVRNDKKPLPSDNNFDKYKNLPTRFAQQLISWELWAKEVIPTDPFILPVDITTDLKFKDIDFSKIPVVGSYGSYPLKKAYYDGNLEIIKNELGEVYDILQNMKPLLKPVLGKIGYKDLLWWK